MPVVPGDDRVVCQHCPARVRQVYVSTLGIVWFDPDAAGTGVLCTPGVTIAHKPMPRIGATR